MRDLCALCERTTKHRPDRPPAAAVRCRVDKPLPAPRRDPVPWSDLQAQGDSPEHRPATGLGVTEAALGRARNTAQAVVHPETDQVARRRREGRPHLGKD